MTDIVTARYRQEAEYERHCNEPECSVGGCWTAGAIGTLCDEIDRLRAKLNAINATCAEVCDPYSRDGAEALGKIEGVLDD